MQTLVKPAGKNGATSSVRWAGWLTGLACAATGLVGLAALAGWTFHSAPLRSGIPGGVAMNPATAVSLLLCGLALWLRRRVLSRPVNS